MKKPILKRIMAYLLDIVIVSFIASLFSSINILNPYIEEYNQVNQEYNEFVSNITDTSELLNSEKLNDYAYDISYYGVYTSIILLIVSILYFGIFQYYNKGKTVGKALLKLQVVDKDKKEINLKQILIRSALINSLLTSTLLIVTILLLSKTKYISAQTIIQFVDMAIIFLSIGMILIREDGRGFHDIIANTMVVDTSELDDEEETKNTEEVKKESTVKKKKVVKEAKVSEKKKTKRKEE